MSPDSNRLGTYQREERTVQVTRGPLIEELGGASPRLVEAYRLHPNAIKSLEPVGQGYLLGRPTVGRKQGRAAAGAAGVRHTLEWALKRLRAGASSREPGNSAHPVCYPRLPAGIEADYELPRNEQSQVDGLRLFERFVSAGSSGAARQSPSSVSTRASRPSAPSGA